MRIVSKVLFAVTAAAPWLWLLAFAGLLGAVTAIEGHLPSYSNPDPKHVPQAYALWLAAFFLAPAACASPLILSAAQAMRQLMKLPLAPGHWILINLAGLAIVLALWFGNPFGLSSWYFD